MKTKKKHPKRHIRPSIKIILCAVLSLTVVILALIYVPQLLEINALKKLGYTDEQIVHIREAGLSDEVRAKEYYSAYLAACFEDDTVDPDYLSLYAAVSQKRGLSAIDFLLYNRLADYGYEEDQLENLFAQLTTQEITPLLAVNYQWDENGYVEDVIANRNTDIFVSGTYFVPYKTTIETDTLDPVIMLVNPTYYVTSAWSVDDLVTLPTSYALDDVQLSAEAAEAFISFCAASEASGAKFYATSGTRSYETQETAWNQMVEIYGEDEAHQYAAKPGFSEHETGMAVNIASTYQPDLALTETDAYKWAIEHCYEYGFIPRYPSGKEYVTGMSAETGHFRYVGKSVAKAVKASGLTYDEFYCLYLKQWDNPSCMPSQTVLTDSSWENLITSASGG